MIFYKPLLPEAELIKTKIKVFKLAMDFSYYSRQQLKVVFVAVWECKREGLQGKVIAFSSQTLLCFQL